MNGVEMVGQTDAEDHLKLGHFLETAEDDAHSGRENKLLFYVCF